MQVNDDFAQGSGQFGGDVEAGNEDSSQKYFAGNDGGDGQDNGYFVDGGCYPKEEKDNLHRSAVFWDVDLFTQENTFNYLEIDNAKRNFATIQPGAFGDHLPDGAWG